MEFMNRGSRPSQPSSTQSATPTHSASAGAGGNNKKTKGLNGLRIASVALLFSATILVVALLWFVVLGSPSSEGKYVDKSKLQAVFLNGGQVYFGKIQDLNDKYLRVGDIYYLRVNQQVQPDRDNQAAAADISLVKLGCELHGPKDEMLINREQVIFWENLKDDGQVAKAVAEYKKQNPNGQKCEEPQAQSTNNNQTNTNSQNNTESEDQ